MTLSFTLNGRPVSADVEKGTTLLSLIRDHFHLTGTKYGCGTGDCGACMVLIDGEAVTSCNLSALKVEGKSVQTIEGVASADGTLHPVQKAFMEAGAVQCGFCTPGMILRALALLRENSAPSEEEIRNAFRGNICRCTGYVKIIDAVRNAAVAIKAQEK